MLASAPIAVETFVNVFWRRGASTCHQLRGRRRPTFDVELRPDPTTGRVEWGAFVMRIRGKQAGTVHRSALMATSRGGGAPGNDEHGIGGRFLHTRAVGRCIQGMSFAGNAAGGALSSMFWNSAATASQDGLNTESSYIGDLWRESKVTVTDDSVPPLGLRIRATSARRRSWPPPTAAISSPRTSTSGWPSMRRSALRPIPTTTPIRAR